MKVKIYETLQNIFNKNRGFKQNEIDYEIVKSIMKNDNDAIILDVRSPQEYKEKHLDGAINIPVYNLERDANNILNNKRSTIIVCCQSGNRSKKAIEILTSEGYQNLYNLAGGLDNI